MKRFNTLVVAMLSFFAMTHGLDAGTVGDQASTALTLIKKNPHLKRAESEVRGLDRVINKRLKKGQMLVGEERPQKNPQSSPCITKYYLFISSSMPLETIRAYVLDARGIRKKGVCIDFVLRGFLKGGKYLYRTIDWYVSFALKDPERALSRSNPPLVWIQINPALAKAAGVEIVPALVSEDGSCVVYGDAKLSYLIEMLEKKQCGQIAGKTYAFAEKNALDQIRRVAETFDWKSYQQKKKKKLLEVAKERLENFSCPRIPHAQSDRAYAVEPIYELEFDIPDPQNPGKVLYPRGFRYNILEYVDFKGSIILIDASRKDQLSALPHILSRSPKPARVFLVGGNYIALSRQYSRTKDVFVYADCRAAKKLIGLYGVCRGGTPCIVCAKGKKFSVTEIGLGKVREWKKRSSF